MVDGDVMIKKLALRLFPEQLNNDFAGIKLALWLFYPFTLLTLWRSQHHLFSSDGGFQADCDDRHRSRCSRKSAAFGIRCSDIDFIFVGEKEGLMRHSVLL